MVAAVLKTVVQVAGVVRTVVVERVPVIGTCVVSEEVSLDACKEELLLL